MGKTLLSLAIALTALLANGADTTAGEKLPVSGAWCSTRMASDILSTPAPCAAARS